MELFTCRATQPRGWSDNLEIEMTEMHKSLRKKELLEGKLARVQRRLSKAKRALARRQ